MSIPRSARATSHGELVEGLKGGAVNDKGEVTLAALLKHVQERVPKHVSADLGSGKEQRPFADIGGYQADQLVIAVANTLAPAPKVASAKPSSNPLNVDLAAFELSYEICMVKSVNASRHAD